MAKRTALFLLIIMLPGIAVAQQTAYGVNGERPTIGVALSGGGVKGFAHAGVLRVIEEMGIPVDVVAGTSMGSFIGALYAVGYSVDQIDSLLLAEDWNVMFEEESPRRQQPLEYRLADEGLLLSLPVRGGQVELPRGIIAGHRISETLSRLFFGVWNVDDFRELPRSFGAVAADLADGEAVLLTSGSLPQAIRASISIPSVFDPVEIGGRTFVDGGVTRNLPAEDAQALGADVVICVDVGEPVLPVDSLKTLVDIMVQSVGFRMRESTLLQQQLCDVLIKPEVTGVRAFDFDRTAEIIARGEAAARDSASGLGALADSMFAKSWQEPLGSVGSLPRPDSVYVSRLAVEGVSERNEKAIRRAMRLLLPRYMTLNDVEEAVRRAFRTQRFDRVTYRLSTLNDRALGEIGTVLTVSAEEREGDRLALGLRYDSDHRASILMRGTLSELLGYDTRLVASIRLGEFVRIGGTLTSPLGFGPRARLFTSAEVSRSPLDLFADGRRTTSLAARVAEASVRAGGFLGSDLAAAVGVRAEAFDIDPRIAGSPGFSFDFLDEASALVFADALLYLDTFDRVSFPRSGARITVRSMLSIGPLSSDTFGQHWVDVESRFPMSERLSLTVRALTGRTVGSSAPVHYRFFAGGVFPFETLAGRHFPLFGAELEEVAGRNIRALWTGVQFRIRSDAFLGAAWNAASASDIWTMRVDKDDFKGGVALSAGVRTVIGPIRLVLSSSKLDGPYELHVGMGHVF